jgi:hypothetical protein
MSTVDSKQGCRSVSIFYGSWFGPAFPENSDPDSEAQNVTNFFKTGLECRSPFLLKLLMLENVGIFCTFWSLTVCICAFVGKFGWNIVRIQNWQYTVQSSLSYSFVCRLLGAQRLYFQGPLRQERWWWGLRGEKTCRTKIMSQKATWNRGTVPYQNMVPVHNMSQKATWY